MKSLSATNKSFHNNFNTNRNNNQRFNVHNKTNISIINSNKTRPNSTSMTPINFDQLFRNLNIIDDKPNKETEEVVSNYCYDLEADEDDEDEELINLDNFDAEEEEVDDVLNDSLRYVKSSTNNKRHAKNHPSKKNISPNKITNGLSKKQRRRLKLNKLENDMHIGASVLFNKYSHQLGLFANMKLPMTPTTPTRLLNSTRLTPINNNNNKLMMKSFSNLNDNTSYSDYIKLVQSSTSMLNNDNRLNKLTSSITKFNSSKNTNLKFKTLSANLINMNRIKQQTNPLKSQSAPNKKFMSHFLIKQNSFNNNNDINNNNQNNSSISEDDSLDNNGTNSFVEIKTIDDQDQDESLIATQPPSILDLNIRKLSRQNQQQRFSKTGSDLNVIEFYTDMSSHSSTNRRSNRQASIKASNKKITFLKISKVSLVC